MSSSLQHFIMVGYDVPEEEQIDSEEYEVLEEEHNIDVVFDGMCGDYVVVGKIISEYDVFSGDGDDGIVSFTPQYLQGYINSVYELLKDHMELSVDDVQLHVIHHWH